MIDQVDSRVGWQVLGAHEVYRLFFFVLDDLGSGSDIVVLEGCLLPQLAAKLFRQLDPIELWLVES